MTVTVVNDWRFKKDGDIEKGMKAADELVKYFEDHVPEVKLSLWLRDRDNPRHFYHITVFDSLEALKKTRESEGIKKFIDALFPEIIHDETYVSPLCDTWLSSGGRLEKVPLQLPG